MYKILSLNGGGIRGIITAYVLKELSELLGGPLRHHFDLVVGTSSGSMLAAGLDHLPESHIVRLSRDIMPQRMFKPTSFNMWGFCLLSMTQEKKKTALEKYLQTLAE